MSIAPSVVIGATRVVVLSHDSRDVRGAPSEFRHFGCSVIVRSDIVSALAMVVHDPTAILVVAYDIPCEELRDVLDLAVASCGSAVMLGLHAGTDPRTISHALDAGVRATIQLPLTAERLADAVKVVGAPDPQNARVQVGPLLADPQQYDALWDGRRLRLSPREFAVVHTLASNHPRATTMEELVRALGTKATKPAGVVHVLVNRVRARIAAVSQTDDIVIETLRGVGYRLTL